MRTRLQGAPWDLYASIGYSVVAAVGLPMFGGSFASFPLIFFVPGYLVVSALFPGNKEIDWIERIALALGLSIAVETLLGLVLNFTIRIDLVGVRIVYSPTLGFNETVEVNRTTLSTLGVTLVDGENWARPYPFSIPYVGLWQVQLLLFKSEGSLSPYRELHIYV